MNILFTIGPLKKGGAERVVANLSNNLIKDNNVVIAVTGDVGSEYELSEKIKVISLDEGKICNNVFKRTIKRIINLKKIIKKEKINIALSFLPEPSYRLMIAQNKRLKTIISVRNDPNIEYKHFWQKILVKLLYSKADGFVFQTKDAQEWFSNKIKRKSTIIPNPINGEFICKPFKGTRDKTIINVGRLDVQKNQKLLIDAFKEISEEYKDYVLKIYGDGPLKKELEYEINRQKLDKKVLLMGVKNDLKSEIYKAGMFVLTSNYEGMPNALMEAMALGLPCISTNCPIGGPKFLINNYENGILIDVNSKKDLVKAIKYVIENSEQSQVLGNNANKICKSLSPEQINKEWKKYIFSVFDNKNK